MANHRVARDWGDTISELLWHFDAVYGEVGDEAMRDFVWGNDSFGLQYEFDAFMKSAPPSVRERAMSRIRTMFKFLKTSHRANRKRASEQNPIDNIDVVDVGGGHAQIHVKSGNLTVFTIYERYNTENYYVMQIERLRNRTSSGIGSYLIDPTEFPYLWEFTHFHNGTGELVPDYLLDEMADELESIWQSSEFSGVTSSRRALPHRQSGRLSNRRRPHHARHRANRRYATSNKTALLSSEFSGMGWTNGHTGLVGHFVAYDNWLWDMVRIGTISGPKELEREFMGSRARDLESMSDIDWSQVDWNDVYNFLSGK